MGQMQFGKNHHDIRDFLPTYGGVDWHEAWQSRHKDEESLSVWGETFDELGEFCEQLHQENCAFYLNDTDDDFDTLVVLDHRDDGGDWWLNRQQLGNEVFEHLLTTLGDEVMIIHSKYPLKMVAEYVMRLMFKDIE